MTNHLIIITDHAFALKNGPAKQKAGNQKTDNKMDLDTIKGQKAANKMAEGKIKMDLDAFSYQYSYEY